MNTGAVQPLTAAEKLPEASKVRKSGEEAQGRPLSPAMDEYVPEDPQEPSGRYWMGRDEDGRPKVYFDGQPRTADAPEQPENDARAKTPEAEEPGPAERGAKGPEGKKDQDEVWECNTDKVDREIEQLKKKRQELEQRLSTESDETKVKDLERRLAQVERDLARKDSDAYRKQHAAYTKLS